MHLPAADSSPSLRPPAVAGAFYPRETDSLRSMIATFMDQVDRQVRDRADHLAAADADRPFARAIIAPHAGYVYSGPIAASAYSFLRHGRGRIKRIVIIGPTHRVGFVGLAAPQSDMFATPLGDVPVDQQTIAALCQRPQVHKFDQAHGPEHCLEVHLPFLVHLLQHSENQPGFVIVPLLCGQVSADDVAEVFTQLWDEQGTVLLISSDLSHYLDYATASRCDRDTAQAIEQNQPHRLDGDKACGHIAIAGLMAAAQGHGLTAHNVDLRNSGDTAGPKDKVVGYGAFIFT